jgi:hypothetical protein
MNSLLKSKLDYLYNNNNASYKIHLDCIDVGAVHFVQFNIQTNKSTIYIYIIFYIS